MAIVRRSMSVPEFMDKVEDIIKDLGYQRNMGSHYAGPKDSEGNYTNMLYIAEDCLEINTRHEQMIDDGILVYDHEIEGRKYIPVEDMFFYEDVEISAYFTIKGKSLNGKTFYDNVNYAIPKRFKFTHVDILYVEDMNEDEAMLSNLFGGDQ